MSQQIHITGTINPQKGEAIMRITRRAEKINLNHVVDVSTDVHKATLYFYFEIGGHEYSDECTNRTNIIEKRLRQFHEIALENGMKSLRIICEPTGQYQNKLFRTARRLGFLTCYVNAESVAKFRMVESNDMNKTDTKDPRVISTLGKLNKTIRFRLLDEEYLMLRKLHKIYDESDVALTSVRCRISKILVELFCDYSGTNDFLYSRSGQSLFNLYGCNPNRIVAAGFSTFCRRMKKAVPRIRQKTLEGLWADACSSVLNELPAGYVAILEERFGDYMEDYHRELGRKEEISRQMVDILQRLREKDPNIPPPTPQVISEKNLARLLGETGPLGDFIHWRKLLRYAGMNIRERQSGKFKGKNKISKKGRPLLRKVLMQIMLPLVRKGYMYGEVYHRKKDEEKRPGTMAMTILARQFLKKLHGWYRSGEAFDEQRFFTCKSQYVKLAKAA
jgi:transposase